MRKDLSLAHKEENILTRPTRMSRGVSGIQGSCNQLGVCLRREGSGIEVDWELLGEVNDSKWQRLCAPEKNVWGYK